MVRSRTLILSALIGGGVLVGFDALPSAAQSTVAQRPIEVRINARLLGHGVLEAQYGSGEPWLRVADLDCALSGRVASSGRLRLAGTALYATATGACGDCLLRVVRAVLITERVRIIGGEPYLPLDDLARALEARLDAEPGGSVFSLYVGACHWCILALAPASSAP